MAKTAKKHNDGTRYVWRDSDSGRMVDVIVADPPVKPKGVSITKIKDAVRKAGSDASRKHR